jgi:hypothetical protein
MGWLQSVSDMTRGKSASIPDSDAHPAPESVSAKRPPCASDWYAPLPEPPDMFRAEPAVKEAERVVR